MKTVLGLIPARGGSKGVPGKNIRMVAGKPLLAHAIACAKAAPSVTDIVVSTDSAEIAAIAKKYGADVPFMRPAELATDTAAMLPVMQHALRAFEDLTKRSVDILLLLDPTGPLRKPEDLQEAVRLLSDGDCDAVLSASRAHRSPYFNMVKESSSGFAELVLISVPPITRRQDSPPVYDLNTVVWGYRRAALMQEEARIPSRARLLLIPDSRSIDLDSEWDFRLLELLLAEQS